MSILPSITYVPNVATGVTSVTLTKPSSQDFPVVASQFPGATDTLKTLSYQAATETIVKQNLATYHSLMAKITSGTGTDTDLNTLKALLTQIRDYVLTEDDYNLMVTAISNIENYIKQYLENDLLKKAQKIDEQSKLMIDTINLFMTQLEQAYSNYPSGWPPVADGTISLNKLSAAAVSQLAYINQLSAVVASPTVPTLPGAGQTTVWIDTNISDAD